MASEATNLIEAVRYEDPDQVKALVESGAPIDERDKKGQTPAILAAKTDNFRIAEYLIQNGADPMAASDFGWSIGYAAETSQLKRGPEFDAKERIIAMLKERGYPFPGPDVLEIERMVEEGNWPPAEWRQGRQSAVPSGS